MADHFEANSPIDHMSDKEHLSANRPELGIIFDLLFSAETVIQMKEWYQSILRSNYDYVVFMTDRCYSFILLLEQLAGNYISESGKTKYLTDGAVLLHTAKMASHYSATGQMPRILIVDTQLIHGRNINHLVRALEGELLREIRKIRHNLADNDGEAQYIIRRDLIRNLSINVFEIANDQSVLYSDIGGKVHYARKTNAQEWRSFCNSISALILAAGMPNQAYIYGEEISEQQFKHLPKEDFIHTEYQNTDEYTKIHLYHDEVLIKAIGTIRVVEHKFSNKYLVIPFIFMPPLNDREEAELFTWLEERVPACSIYHNEVMTWKERFGRRTFNEYISLILSSILLNDFNDSYSIARQILPSDIVNLARNYFGPSHEFDYYCRLISDSINDARISQDELGNILARVHKATNAEFFQYSHDKGTYAEDDEEILKGEMEDLFYCLGANREAQAIYLMRNNHIQSPKRYARNLFENWNIIQFIYTESSCDDSIFTLQLVTALMLQFIDAEVLEVSSYPSVDFNIDGFMQYVKAGNQSLFTKPIRNYRYLPMLQWAESEAAIHERTLEEEMRRYFSSASCVVPEKDKKELLRFSSYLVQSGQKIKDWNTNLSIKIRFSEKAGIARGLNELIQAREETLSNYRAFCK